MRKSKYSYLCNYPLHPIQRGALMGMMLGDSCITYTDSTKYHLVTEHAEKQKEYLEFKKSIFPNLIPSESFCVDHRPRMNSVTWRWQSINHTDLENIHKMFYKDGVKKVTKEIMQELSVFGLALWYFDDGHFDTKYKQYRIITHSFDLDGQKVMREMLRRKFKIETSILGYYDKKYNKQRYHLYVTKKSQEQLERLIGPFVIPCIEYKFGRVKTNPQRLDVSHFIATLHNEVMLQSDLNRDIKSATEMIAPPQGSIEEVTI